MPQKRRRRKSGKYAPLIWIITAALIAFFIGYSNIFKTLIVSQKNQHTDSENNSFNLTNIIPITPVQGSTSSSKFSASSETFSAVSNRTTNQQLTNNTEQTVRVKIYLANRGDKEISLVEKTVLLPKTQSMLRDTLQLLIGYNDDKLINLVPIKTKIRKITIRDGIALIDLSDDFAYNSNGVLGYEVQVYQIVYTATQFRNVKAVAFYINGKLADYLGGDGYPVHNPVYPFSYMPKFPLE